MLAKVIVLKKCWKTVSDAANYVMRDAAEYIAREGVLEAGSFNLEGLNPANLDDKREITKLMDATAKAWASKTRAKPETNPFYHVVLSWKDGEKPTLEQAKKAAEKALEAVGMSNNQAFFAIHRDKDHHHHIHIIANRLHPDKLVLTGPPRYDFLTLDKTCREIELGQGWQHDNGPFVVIDNKIQRLTRTQRQQLGLLVDQSVSNTPAVKARMGEVQAGLPSLSGWLKNKVAPELIAAQNWQEFHAACSQRGLSVIKVKSGLIFETNMLDKATQTKASAVHYSLSLGRLQKQFGDYQPPDIAVDPAKTPVGSIYGATYNDYVARVVCGIDPDSQEHPGRTGQGDKRAKARFERAEARTVLFEQYKNDKYNAKDTRSAARLELRDAHKAEKTDLLKTLHAIKAATVANYQHQFGNDVARSLWAAKRTAAVEELAERQKNERLALTRAHATDWLPWLERQAEQGNEAAISALRGLRYRAQRAQNQQKAGFDGEDLGSSKPQKEPTQSNSINGENHADHFNIRNAQLRITLDHKVEYLDNKGTVRLTDAGPRIDLSQENDLEAMRAGLQLASQKYGGEVFITGSLPFREFAAKEALDMGIKVRNQELNHIKKQVEIKIETEFER